MRLVFSAVVVSAWASTAWAAPATYSAHVSAEGRSYTVILSFLPAEGPPTAEVLWSKQTFPAGVEADMGSYAGKTRCTASASFQIGSASLSVVDDATRAVRNSWKESAPSNLVVAAEGWSDDSPTGCGIEPGPLPGNAYFYVEGPLTVSIPDLKGGEPILSIKAQVVRRTALEGSPAALAKSGERALRLEGFDAAQAPSDFGALVTRRLWLPWAGKWSTTESVVDFKPLP